MMNINPMKLFSKPIKQNLINPIDRLEIGGLYDVQYIDEDWNEVHHGPYVYLGFGQDETVEYIKTGYLFLDVKACKKICMSNLPSQAKIEKLS